MFTDTNEKYRVIIHYAIDLYYEESSIIEEEPSVLKIVLDILDIQGIFFGLNAFNSIMIGLNIVKIKFKISFNKLILNLVYFVCGIGFSFQAYFIFKEIIDEELVKSQYYEALESVNLPDISLCLKIGETDPIDPNQKLTGNYLNKVTENKSIEYLIKSLSYLDEHNHWIHLNSHNLTSTKDIKIKNFYFLDKKCFLLRLEKTYGYNQFYFRDNNYVLRIYFRKDEDNLSQKVYFFPKNKGTSQVNQILKFQNGHYFIKQEQFHLKQYDKFSSIKNPLSIYDENESLDVKYLDKLFDKFKETFNLVTMNLFIKKNNFNVEVNDEIFEQFFVQIQNLTDMQSIKNLNFERLFIETNYEIRMQHQLSFEFSLVFFKKRLDITNEDNFAKLILKILNVLSLWLDLGILDIYVYIYKVKLFIIVLFKFLLRQKMKIRKALMRLPYSDYKRPSVFLY